MAVAGESGDAEEERSGTRTAIVVGEIDDL
jgi:hypothetical protein